MLIQVWSLCHPSNVFFLHPYLFQQDNPKTHSEDVTTVWPHSKIIMVLDWPICGSDLKMCGALWSTTFDNGYLGLLSNIKLESWKFQEKLQQLVFLFSKCLSRDTMVNMSMPLLFWNVLSATNLEWPHIYLFILIKFIHFNIFIFHFHSIYISICKWSYSVFICFTISQFNLSLINFIEKVLNI